jgi:hypothetical protein
MAAIKPDVDPLAGVTSNARSDITGSGAGIGSISGQAAENAEDEANILGDSDQVGTDPTIEDDDMGRGGRVTGDLEQDEPGEFVRGELDVKTQIDRTTRIMQANLGGHHLWEDPSDPDETPGGLDDPDFDPKRPIRAARVDPKAAPELRDEEKRAPRTRPDNPNAGDVVTEGLDASVATREGLDELRSGDEFGEDDELILPTEELDDIAGEESMSLGDLGESSIEAARASGYYGENERGFNEEKESDRKSDRSTGALTDVGAGRSSSVRKRRH